MPSARGYQQAVHQSRDMTEAETRAALTAFDGPGGLRVVTSANGGKPAVWTVPRRS